MIQLLDKLIKQEVIDDLDVHNDNLYVNVFNETYAICTNSNSGCASTGMLFCSGRVKNGCKVYADKPSDEDCKSLTRREFYKKHKQLIKDNSDELKFKIEEKLLLRV